MENPPMSPAVRRLLLLSVSVGAGHVRAAQAVEAAAREAGLEVEHLDAMDHVSSAFRKVYKDLYIDLVERHPQWWARLYQASDRADDDDWSTRVRRAVERVSARGLRAAVAAARADAIVCTHFLPAELLARDALRGHALAPTWVLVTDFDLHRLWVQPSTRDAGVRGWFVASDEVAFRVREALPGVRVEVTGIPIMPAFARAPERETAARELGLDPSRPTALVMTGGAGLVGGAAMVERLLSIEGDPSAGLGTAFQLVGVAGKSAELLARYQELARTHPGRLVPLGFTTTIERVMAACDLAITKPGGLSTSECLAMGLPMLLISPIPGQEERNAQHLLEQGAAWLAIDAPGLEWRFRRWLADPQAAHAMAQRARALGRPHAARAVVEHVTRDRG
jgi:processive 1,2-diacylglycerol beta-glucosyltransferase